MPRRDADTTPRCEVSDDRRRSGLIQAEFSRRRGLSLHAFRKHRYARPDSSPAPGPTPAAPGPPDRPRLVPVTPRLVPVTLVAGPVTPESSPDANPLVLILDGRRRIAIAPGFDPDTPRRLIEVIEARP